MIQSYRGKEAARLARGERARRLPDEVTRRARMRLARIHAATRLEDLRQPPSHRLEALKGDRAGQYSIRINDQWRICFEWRDGHAYNVEIVDYH
ncbi:MULTISPECIES: type II toxin-antitoxin system RelE/ParE family toxin [unclassified Thioalkalivibrio]|uniref:type II toxin-antitoxin system RelE/ParE family toxin n=1 Tax=unclassified Thioalkalivibrio TaxID=2621013 RepID=UPI00037CC4CB|nr:MULTISPECIES: type II toxin-antitoxin system RelE/ParE family toxin [unclassified Thioalkalivibrio]